MPTSREGVGATAEGHALEGLASLHVAIVCATDGARFVVVAADESECLAQIAASFKSGEIDQTPWGKFTHFTDPDGYGLSWHQAETNPRHIRGEVQL